MCLVRLLSLRLGTVGRNSCNPLPQGRTTKKPVEARLLVPLSALNSWLRDGKPTDHGLIELTQAMYERACPVHLAYELITAGTRLPEWAWAGAAMELCGFELNMDWHRRATVANLRQVHRGVERKAYYAVLHQFIEADARRRIIMRRHLQG